MKLKPKDQILQSKCRKYTWSSIMEPEIDPIAQQRVFKLFHDQSSPLSCLLNFFSICLKTTFS